MLYSLGFDNVSILNGGFAEWTRLHLPIETEKNIFEPANFQSKIKINSIFVSKGITSDKIIINYCGGGIAATLNAFALFQAGFRKFKVYDNSMSEWAMDETLPIEIG